MPENASLQRQFVTRQSSKQRFSKKMHLGSHSLSGSGSQELTEIMHSGLFGQGLCRVEPLSDRGKRFQLIKILCLTLLPILCVWGFTVYSLTDSVTTNEQTQTAKRSMEFVIQLGLVLHRLQIERDMSVLYISALGTKTKTFLLSEYIKTDNAILALTSWPAALKSSLEREFTDKAALMNYVSQHRNSLEPHTSDLYAEIGFYSDIINTFLLWLIQSVQEAGFGSNWKTLVAYQKLTRGKEEVGVERAYGTLFYILGQYPRWDDFEMYNEKIYVFQYNYDSARFYSDLVAPLHQIETKDLTSRGRNVTDIIDGFRHDIQYHKKNTSYQSLDKAQWLFDNMTTYLDTLLIIQQDVANLIMQQINEVIDQVIQDVSVYAVLLVIVLLMCPLILFLVEALTSNIQRYTLTLVSKTKELNEEKQKTDWLLYQMMPKSIAENLKNNLPVEAEYFNSVTILFLDVFGFTKMSTEIAPMELVEIMNNLYKAIDDTVDHYDVYKVETINDCYMVASGLPNRNGGKHAFEVAGLALELLRLVKVESFSSQARRTIHLRIGINSGSCMAGIVGSTMLRYCLFGDTVNVASRMKSYGMPGKIHISERTNNLLKKTLTFLTKLRGTINVKGKGNMATYWLLKRLSDGEDNQSDSQFMAQEFDESMPGEIMQYSATVAPPTGPFRQTDYVQPEAAGFQVNEGASTSANRKVSSIQEEKYDWY